jgi:hypothetical protein
LPDDRELAERHVERVTLPPHHIELQLRHCGPRSGRPCEQAS